MWRTRRLELELLNEKGAESFNGAQPAKPKDALLPYRYIIARQAHSGAIHQRRC